jgi:hypothetical protein
MNREEYHKTMRILEFKERFFEIQGKVPAVLKFQGHIISRIEDITNIETGDLCSHDKVGMFSLQTKVSWSKHVMEERSCPYQISIGASDTYFCILLDLACYLEIRLNSNHHGRYLFGDSSDGRDPDHANSR